MSLIDDFSLLYTAATGKPADASVEQRIRAMVDMSARDEGDFPAYLGSMARALATGAVHGPVEVPQRDRGYSWVLREFEPALPGAELRNDPYVDRFIVPNLGHAAVITRGPEPETWSVIPWPPPSPPQVGPTILDTFDPTPEQIRLWAYSPNTDFAAQDEDLAVSQALHVPLLIELASDPGCPKRAYILAIVDCMLVNARRTGYNRKLLREARNLVAQSSLPDLRSWAHDLDELLEYLDGGGTVPHATAQFIAAIAMVGRCQPYVRLSEIEIGDWWEFTANVAGPREIGRLYINRNSGALLWSRDPVTPAELAPFANPSRRDGPLALR